MNFLQKFREKQHSVLLVNTIMLYILRFSTIFLSFITQGYQSRVLGMELLGTLGAAQYTTNFFQIFIDFGFILSATAEVSRQRDDKKALSRVLTSVVLAKTAFIAISFAVLFLFVAPGLKDDKEVLTYVLFLVGTALNSFLPDFMYRGLEQMTTITVRAVSIRAFATAMIFLFIHAPGDYYLVPLFTALGNAGALVFVYWHLFCKIKVGFCRVTLGQVWREIRYSFQFFVSQAVTSVYSNTNGIILKATLGGVAAGLYTNADKVISAAKNAMGPIADSLYPHMVKHKSFHLIKKALLMIYPVILLGCAGVFVLAEPLLVFWLGEEGAQVAAPLRMLIPVAVFAFPNYLLGYPTLGAMGLVHYVNISSIGGVGVYLAIVGILAATGNATLLTLCAATSCSELAILLFRIGALYKNRRLLRENEH